MDGISAGTLILLALLLSSCTQNWPQFRGPDANLVASAKNLPDTWSETENIRWSAELEGESWTSPVIWGNKVFVASAVPVKTSPEQERQQGPRPQPQAQAQTQAQTQAQAGNAGSQGAAPPPQSRPERPDPRDDKSYLEDVYRWEVSCLDLASGEILWKTVAREGSPGMKKHRATNYASETPVTDGKRLYVYFGMNGLYCYDLDGALLWEKDLGAHYTLNGWGTGSSPVLYKGSLFVQVDNEDESFVVALDAKSGEELWKKDRDEGTNYSTPFVWKNSFRTELVVGGKTTTSYDPGNGEILWELNTEGYYTIPSPVADGDLLYLGNTARRNTPGTFFCVKAGAEGNITPAEGESTSSGVLWSDLDAPTSNPSPLLYEGLIYLLSNRGGELTCLDATTGEQVYQEKIEGVGACWASPWAHQDKIFFTDEKGITTVVQAGREFEFLHQNTLDDKVWASVAVSSDAYLIKGIEKLYCIAN